MAGSQTQDGEIVDAAVAADADELLILALCLVCGAVAPLAVSSSEIHGMELVAGCTAIAGEMCHARMLSPVPDGLIVRGFDRPEWQWSPGHRGVDISLNGMHELLAPSDGAISFSGMVAGKSVVSIDTGPYTLTFEPAHTQLAVGDKVHRGKRFASVGGQSDHCGESCVHWGVKRTGRRDYLDPASFLRPMQIRLVPYSE